MYEEAPRVQSTVALAEIAPTSDDEIKMRTHSKTESVRFENLLIFIGNLLTDIHKYTYTITHNKLYTIINKKERVF